MKKLRIDDTRDVATIDKRMLFDMRSFQSYFVPNIECRHGGEFRDCALYLDPDCDWELGIDNEGSTILVPIKRICDEKDMLDRR